MLAGTAGAISAQEDVIGRRIADSVTLLREPIDGRDLRLTIDAGVQHLLEQEIYATYVANSATGATGLIMDAETGRHPRHGQLPVVRREPVRHAPMASCSATRPSRASTSRDR